ncbi:DNA helicase UvrD [Polaribacter aestuariivivens]|uniref:DNA 3'-5' helicase n=1 Tax=Polaribacter aestuariivivens TaxID=2304626 RepID=A0A5S3N3P3_9FLAO|nr:UvrD-helicase domain-containing protein [Polaribacter aestuariivivens]TMM29935.1 DNA helicase UvrD [Polaribacter aestuariivivens]
MRQPSTFQVYNASAGSGKTFTLVKEYLKILLNSEDIFRFQKILAITFTNKAAGEMKERVLENLEDFTEGKENDLFKIIIEEISVDKPTIQQRSKKILDAILQNYAAFSITTIDSFTHKIIKNFAYDLGLPLNFEVEMDAVSLLNEAVDVLISKIGTDKKLTNLLIDYSLDKIDDDKSWDISKDLNDFAKILLNEDDNKHFRELADKKLDDFTNLKSKLFTHQKELKKSLKEVGQNCLNLINSAGLEPKDFMRGTVPKFFADLTEKSVNIDFIKRSETIEKAIANNQYYTKTAKLEITASIDAIVPEIIEFFHEAKKIYQQFLMNKLALKSIIPLAVLNNINTELDTIKEENNIRLNAEFNQLISDNIKDQPAPFIYERIGQRFMHYFIDEMQDTSVLQWQNLIPLIDNALAQENSNLMLVGDGKQAIYRWRGGKAEQFINLGSETENEKNLFQISKDVKELETNFRSYSEIIDFNNSFFQHSSKFLQNEDYKKLFFEGNQQKENAKKGGFVSLSFLEKEDDKKVDKLKYPKKVFEKIKELENDFSLGEICILTRTKKDGVAVANYLSENGINIISSETLLLQNNVKINFIINVLKVLQHPNNEESRFEMLYFLHEHLQVEEPKHQFLKTFAKSTNEVIFQNLKKYGITFEVSTFQQLPFYEKIEEIVRGFRLIDSSNAYIQFFLDVVLEQQRKSTNMQDFLDFWEIKKEKLSIVAPENTNAVQVMTIHKSKGLEFPVVIFPCNVDIYQQINPKVWLDELPESYANFQELLVPYNRDLSYVNATGLEIFNSQREALELDNFNLLYVALTRAVEQLHVITDKKLVGKNKEEDLKFYSGFFINYLKEKSMWNDDLLNYSFGNKKRVSYKKEDNSVTEIHEKFIGTPWKEHNIILLAGASKLWNTAQGEAIDYGNLLHEIFSKIKTNQQIEEVVMLYEQQGILDKNKRKFIKEKIKSVVNHPKLSAYYLSEENVFNEREIVTIDNQIIIPDRLVFNTNKEVTIIDYKTGAPSKKHHQQIKNYESVLKTMNYKIDKKILIYINEKIDVVEV